VLAALKHQPGDVDGIAQALDRGHRPRLQGAPVHQDGVELDAAVAVQVGADAGVKHGIVFEHEHGLLAGLHRRAAPLEHFPAARERSPDARPAGCGRLGGNLPRPSVHRQRELAQWMTRLSPVFLA